MTPTNITLNHPERMLGLTGLKNIEKIIIDNQLKVVIVIVGVLAFIIIAFIVSSSNRENHELKREKSK